MSTKSYILTFASAFFLGGLLFTIYTVVNTEVAQGDEGYVTYEELRKYDHDIATKEGGIFDLWEDSKRQDRRIQNVWKYTNNLDARVYELEKKMSQTQEVKVPEIVAMISNEGGQSIQYNDGSVKNTINYTTQNLIELGVNESVSMQIIESCKTARNPAHCVESIVGVSNAESSLFKKCYMNNCMGLMKKGQVIRYASVEEKIIDWVNRYNKYWFRHDYTQNWIKKSRYCTSACESWVSNFDDGVQKLRNTRQ